MLPFLYMYSNDEIKFTEPHWMEQCDCVTHAILSTTELYMKKKKHTTTASLSFKNNNNKIKSAFIAQ